jgi:hypothetical protein
VNGFSEWIPPAALERIKKKQAFINPPFCKLSFAAGVIGTGKKSHPQKDGEIR